MLQCVLFSNYIFNTNSNHSIAMHCTITNPPQLTDYFVVVLCTQVDILTQISYGKTVNAKKLHTSLVTIHTCTILSLRFPPTLRSLQKTSGTPTPAFLFSQGTFCILILHITQMKNFHLVWKIFCVQYLR